MQRCGYVANVGRKPNVGKPALLGHILGHKFSITRQAARAMLHRLQGA